MKKFGKAIVTIFGGLLGLVAAVIGICVAIFEFRTFTIKLYEAPAIDQVYYTQVENDYMVITLKPDKYMVLDYIYADRNTEGMTRCIYDLSGSTYG